MIRKRGYVFLTIAFKTAYTSVAVFALFIFTFSGKMKADIVDPIVDDLYRIFSFQDHVPLIQDIRHLTIYQDLPRNELPFPSLGTTVHLASFDPARFHTPLQISTRPSPDLLYTVTIFSMLPDGPVMRIYLKAGHELKVGAIPGVYRVVIATGKKWYGDDYLFGAKGQIFELRNKLNVSFDGSSTLVAGPTFKQSVVQ